MPFILCNVLDLVAVLPARHISRPRKQLITIHVYIYHAMTSNGRNSYDYSSKGASQLMWYKSNKVWVWVKQAQDFHPGQPCLCQW